MTARRTHKRSPAFMKAEEHRALWVLVEGGVVDALSRHPDYLTAKGEMSAVQSITKRVVGQLVGRAKQVRKDSRFGDSRPTSPQLCDGETIPRTDDGILAVLHARKARGVATSRAPYILRPYMRVAA